MSAAFALAALVAAATPPGQMIIWSGGSTRAEADAQRAAMSVVVKALAPVLELEPVVVESATVAGLKPGFFVVSLGVCSAPSTDAVLATLHVVRPAVYAREVTVDASAAVALPCPRALSVEKNDDGEPVPWKLERVVSTGTGPASPSSSGPGRRGKLVAASFTWTWGERGDFAAEYKGVAIAAFLVDDKGNIVAAESVPGPSASAQKPSRFVELTRFDASAGAVTADFDFASPSCGENRTSWSAYKQTITVVVAGAAANALAVRKGDVRNGGSGDCFSEERHLFETGEGRH